MEFIQVRYRNGVEFLAHYQTTFPAGGIFYPTRRPIETGTPVSVEVRFAGLPNRVVLRGMIEWRRAGRHAVGLRAGWGIAFAEDATQRRDFVLRVARGDAGALVHRRHRRLAVHTPATWRPRSELVPSAGTLADIGPGGAYVVGDVAPARGSDVVLTITPPGALAPVDVEGRVVWVREHLPEGHFGVQFKVRDVGGLRRIKEVVRRLAHAAA